MGHRALVAYERPNGQYNLHYSHWGGLTLRLQHELTPDTPFGGTASDTDPEWAAEHFEELLSLPADRAIGRSCPEAGGGTTVDPQPRATDVRFEEVITEHLDYLTHEAFYVVDSAFVVTTYRTLWFGLQYDCETIEEGPTIGNGALVTVRWYDGEPVGDGFLRGQFTALKAVVGDMLDRGVFTHQTAQAYIRETLAEWVGPHQELLIPSSARA